ncbi:hypothetical protein CS0771_65140 [Catellatospora sp. IY07-71]|uniref:ATP-binding protein n=1 Tax=Catellatospora sp. IY07-71 TaxID=2728827 RepID=UPI001BB45344|nr:ATP-binding protein [Catellatospora sp. IY07-71]BCJ76970.1 hypothetical protein CS0771_65140 [Catellatospora sp. IY07-71]
MATRLRVKSITVQTADAQKVYEFDNPLTALIGSVGTGKSSLLMLLKHALGGRAALTPAVRENVTNVIVDLEVGDVRLALRRSVPDRVGTVDVIDPFTFGIERSLSVRAGAGVESVSDYLLTLLGFPRERVPTRRRGATEETVALTFQNLWEYVYIEAVDIDREIAGHRQHWSNRARLELFKLMFKFSDSEVNRLRRQEGELNSAVKRYKEQVDAVKLFLEAGQTPPAAELAAKRRDIHATLTTVSRALQNLRSATTPPNESDPLFVELDFLMQREQRLQTEAATRAGTVQTRRALLAQLELDLLRLDRSDAAEEALGRFDYLTCPRCFQDLQHHSHGLCRVCGQPDPLLPVSAATHADARLRLEEQISETAALLEEDAIGARTAEEELLAARLHVLRARAQIDRISRERIVPAIAQIEDFSARQATLLAELERLDEFKRMWGIFAEFESKHRQTTHELRQVRLAIRQHGATIMEARQYLAEFEDAFRYELSQLNIPGVNVQMASIDPEDFLPRIGGARFEEVQASGGGVTTAIRVAYNLALLRAAIDHPDILLPSLLIIDSPQNAIGRNESDVRLSQRIYERLYSITNVAGDRLQIIVADNELPPAPPKTDWRMLPTIKLDYGLDAMVPGVFHPGIDSVTVRVEDASADDVGD